MLFMHYVFTSPGVRKGFVRAVFKKLKAEAKDSLPEDATQDAATEATRLEVAFVNALGRKDKEKVAQIDMEQELKDLKLYDFFPYAQWPPNAPVCPPPSRLSPPPLSSFPSFRLPLLFPRPRYFRTHVQR